MFSNFQDDVNSCIAPPVNIFARLNQSMKTVTVMVKTEARNSIEEKGGVLYISVRAKPKGGRANIAVIDMLSRYFGVGVEQVHFVKGKTSRRKVFSIY